MIQLIVTLYTILRRAPDVIRRLHPHLEGLRRIWVDIIRNCGRRRRTESHKKDDTDLGEALKEGQHGRNADYPKG